ncbi:MAG: hypothetical protein J2P48_20725 [Alphaproteobacteria bacterium]|nr:hypothetical protein [Alphaproteobacteria bacterium]
MIEFRRPVGRIVNGFKKAVTRSGIAACTIHDLRRTAASFAQVAAYLGDTDEVIRRQITGCPLQIGCARRPRAVTPDLNQKAAATSQNLAYTIPFGTLNSSLWYSYRQ